MKKITEYPVCLVWRWLVWFQCLLQTYLPWGNYKEDNHWFMLETITLISDPSYHIADSLLSGNNLIQTNQSQIGKSWPINLSWLTSQSRSHWWSSWLDRIFSHNIITFQNYPEKLPHNTPKIFSTPLWVLRKTFQPWSVHYLIIISDQKSFLINRPRRAVLVVRLHCNYQT